MTGAGVRTDVFVTGSAEELGVTRQAFGATSPAHFPYGGPTTTQSGVGSRMGIFRTVRSGTEQVLRMIISSRAQRVKFLPDHLFADPAWDMLLDLYLADILSKRVSVSSLCGASNVPASTALRWIRTLEREGLIERASDPYDGRRYFIFLSEKGTAAMDGFFESRGALNIQ